MAKKKPTKTPAASEAAAIDLGPLPVCPAMLIVESVIKGEDQVLSLIRVVDVITIGSIEGHVNGKPFGLFGVKLVILLRANEARGKCPVIVVSVGPNDERRPIGEAPVDFGKKDTGVNLELPFMVIWHGPGLYWLELQTKSGRLIAKTPIMLILKPNDSEVATTAKKPK